MRERTLIKGIVIVWISVILLKGDKMPKMKCSVQFIKYFLVLIIFILPCACMSGKGESGEYYIPPIKAEKVAFLGFKAALSPGQEGVLYHNPLSGVSVRSEPVSQITAERLSGQFYDMLNDSKDCNFINLRSIKNITDPSLFKKNNNDPVKILQSVGDAVSADVVLTGYVYRMHEREGSEYSAENPASVSFDVYLVSVKDGTFLWKGSFDKTQKSLSENLLELKEFLDFKGKWVDVEKLAQIGLNELIKEIPLKNK